LTGLATDDALIERIAAARKWKASTIKQLSLEGYLGWYQ
jgi:hypothetical protein